MDARIGILNNGEYYAFVDGYDAPEVRGTLEAVETALGLRAAPVAKTGNTYSVTLRFQCPAWDEKDGIVYEVEARTKAEAISYARSQARNDGHAQTGKGRYTFTAEEA